MSNHYHLVVIDHDGRIPDFLCDFNSFLSRCINAHLGRWESLWDAAQTSLVELTDAASQLEKTTYVLTNPVKDHLVGSLDSWPGANSFQNGLKGRAVVSARPDWFFQGGGKQSKKASRASAPKSQGKSRLPEVERLSFCTPPLWEKAEFQHALRAAVSEAESQAESTRRAERRKHLGRRAVLRQHWNHAPKSHAPHREHSPRVAGRDKWRRLEAIRRNKRFLEAYRAALKLYQEDKEYVFPEGTWMMVRAKHIRSQSG